MKIRLATDEIQRDSIVDGEGIRTVIWTQGCSHHCPYCHNPETHSYQNGFLLDIEDIKKKIDTLEGQDGITFSGGDPMEQPLACSVLAKYCHQKKLNVWCYTGYTFEELLDKAKTNSAIMEFLKQIDVLVDGKFLYEQKSYDVIFRGSKNQRLIDVQKSLFQKKAVLYQPDGSEVESKRGRSKKHLLYV